MLGRTAGGGGAVTGGSVGLTVELTDTGGRTGGFGAGVIVLNGAGAFEGAGAAIGEALVGLPLGGFGGADCSPNGFAATDGCEGVAAPKADLSGGTNADATGFSRPPTGTDGGTKLAPKAGVAGSAGDGARVDGKDGIGVATAGAGFGNAEPGPNGLDEVGANGGAAGLG